MALQRLQLRVGEYKVHSSPDDLPGWLLCDGRSLSRERYAELFEVIGTTFGSDNAQTFRLPDFRSRVVGVAGQGPGLTSRALGASVGAETHTLTSQEMPAHSHGGATGSSGDHTHGIVDPGHSHTQTTINDDFNNSGTSPPGFAGDSSGSRTWNNINASTTGISVSSSGAHTHAISSSGGGQAHNIMQPTLFGAHVFIFTAVMNVEPQ
jgi:microcystin-dependent protein